MESLKTSTLINLPLDDDDDLVEFADDEKKSDYSSPDQYRLVFIPERRKDSYRMVYLFDLPIRETLVNQSSPHEVFNCFIREIDRSGVELRNKIYEEVGCLEGCITEAHIIYQLYRISMINAIEMVLHNSPQFSYISDQRMKEIQSGSIELSKKQRNGYQFIAQIDETKAPHSLKLIIAKRLMKRKVYNDLTDYLPEKRLVDWDMLRDIIKNSIVYSKNIIHLHYKGGNIRKFIKKFDKIIDSMKYVEPEFSQKEKIHMLIDKVKDSDFLQGVIVQPENFDYYFILGIFLSFKYEKKKHSNRYSPY